MQILCKQTTAADVVVVLANLNQAKVLLEDAVHIVVIADNAVFEFHFAVCTKLIITDKTKAVALCFTDVMIVRCGQAVTTDIVVIIADLDQTATRLKFAANDISVNGFILKLDNGGFLRNRESYAIFIKEIDLLFLTSISSAIDITAMNITIFVKAVLDAINFLDGQAPIAGVVVRTNVISVISINVKPLTLGNRTGFTKVIQSAANHAITGVCLIVISEAIPSLINLNPTVLDEDSVDSIITSAFEDVQAGFIQSVTTMAGQGFANHGIIVTSCFLDSTPIQNGLANGTLGASGVTVGSTSSCEILYRLFGVVMPFADGILQVCNRRIQLGTSVYSNIGEAGNIHIVFLGIFHITVLNLVADGNLRRAAIYLPLILCSGEAKLLIPAPCIHRNGEQGFIAGGVAINASHSDISSAGVLIQGVLHLKAIEHHHMLQSPLGRGVEPQLEVNSRNALNLIGVQKNVILTAGIQQTIILNTHGNTRQGDTGNFGFCVDNDLLGKLGIVTLLIRDLKGNIVGAIGQLNATCRDLACCKLGGNLMTVDVHLGGGFIQAGIVCTAACIFLSACSYGDGIIVQSSSINREAGLVFQNQSIRNDGHITVIYSVTVVKGDIINVESNLFRTGSRRGNNKLNECRGIVRSFLARQISVFILIIGSGNIGIGDLLHVHIDICPTCLRNLITGQLGETLLHIHICQVQICSIQFAGSIILVGISETGTASNRFLGDVHPHTQTCAGNTLRGIEQGNRRTPVVEVCILPVRMCSRITIVYRISERIITAVHLTVRLICKEYIFMNAIFNQVAGSRTYRLVNRRIAVIIFAIFGSFYQIEVVTPILGIFFATFKVEEDIGTLTKGNIDNIRCNGIIILILNRYGCRRTCALRRSRVNETVHSTCRAYEGVYIGSRIHIRTIIQRSDCKVRRFAVRNHFILSAECDFGGMSHSYINGTNDFTLAKHLNGYRAQLTVGHKQTISNGAEGIIRQSPGNVLGNFSNVTALVCAICNNIHIGVRCIEGVLGAQVCMVKGTICHCSGDNHQGVRDGTDGAVTGAASQNDLIGTFQLRSVGSRSATVQLDCCNTALIHHDLSLFHIGQTCRIRLLVAVSKHQNDIAIRLNADSRTGIFIGVVGCNNLSIPHQHLPTADSFLDLVSILAEGALLTDHCSAIL